MKSMEVHNKSMHVNEFLLCHHSNENSLAVFHEVLFVFQQIIK